MDHRAKMLRNRDDRIKELEAMLLEVISNIDVSTINNSKRSTDRWCELKQRARALLGV